MSVQNEKPKFRTPYAGPQKPVRTFGLRVHPEEVKRVDAFRSAFQEGSRMRAMIEASLAKGKEGKPGGITDHEYFTMLGKNIMDGGNFEMAIHNSIIRRLLLMPASVQGDAFRVALMKDRPGGDAAAMEDLHRDLATDGMENVPGEKEDQVVQVVRRHVQRAQMEGKIMRAGQALVYDFSQKLGNADPEAVNLFYYGQDFLERILNVSLETREFLVASKSVREWLMEIANQASQLGPEKRLTMLRDLAGDMEGALEKCRAEKLGAAEEAARMDKMINNIFWTYTYHGPGFL